MVGNSGKKVEVPEELKSLKKIFIEISKVELFNDIECLGDKYNEYAIYFEFIDHRLINWLISHGYGIDFIFDAPESPYTVMVISQSRFEDLTTNIKLSPHKNE